ncbi:hypothetical protein HK103_006155 [Boothiomyces macroporosus]|uniref:Guanylate kinase n=1 Tax=Boothiomyces macroporosus TaxID=261099 RepID=A0AAD5Y295_9FUNG|nr:hypothetical protein HK103_006155 [Boothiomyces macroporosus]
MLSKDVQPIVLCGPSGAGKSTLLKKLFADYPSDYGFSISHTSRKPRPGETDGVHYHYREREEILDMISKGLFIESAEFSGNIYGTSFESVKQILSQGKNVILDIEMQGVKQLQQKMKTQPELIGSKILYIFIAPPSIADLEKRLKGRGTETEESLKQRLETAKGELKWGLEPGNVDYVITNTEVDKAYNELLSEEEKADWNSTDPEHPVNIIPELCSDYYYIAPSGVQKERIEPYHLFILNKEKEVVHSPPKELKFNPSQCTPLFFNAYDMRNAGACIHTHSQNAVMATLLWPGKEFVITHQEMIKGIRKGSTDAYHKYYDKITVPIIENTAEERDLKDRMAQAMKDYPLANAVLVRRHGVYVWGDTWQKVKMKSAGMDPEEIPADSEYAHHHH